MFLQEWTFGKQSEEFCCLLNFVELLTRVSPLLPFTGKVMPLIHVAFLYI